MPASTHAGPDLGGAELDRRQPGPGRRRLRPRPRLRHLPVPGLGGDLRPEDGHVLHDRRDERIRVYASSALLADGRVLITGGNADGSDPLASAEIYNPTTGKFV
jgi:hypothetical protein